MNEAVLLFLLRVASGVVLFAFLAALAWFVYKDLKQSAAAVTSGREAQGHLRVLASDVESAAKGTIFPLLPVTRIGRAESNTIVLEDSFVSLEHALISRRDKLWWLEDLESRNGTLLNDLQLDGAAVVSAGDVMTIGSVQLKIELETI
jgi:FHA domain